ncbi:MAG: tetratricopeptide repeat protein [Bacteroidales bacterium]
MIKVKAPAPSDSAVTRDHSGFQGNPNPPPWFLRKGYPLLWFAIVAFMLFMQTISFKYTYLDDQTLILGSMDKLKSVSYVTKAFNEDVFHAPSTRGFYYRPVLTLSFMADALTGGGNISMFHFSNIVYHILAAFLLFLFFVEAGFDRVKSFLFTLIFLVHPMVTQAVAWIPGRNDSLLAIFILGSFLFWLKYLKTGSVSHLLFHLVFYLVALFTKENAIVLPVLVIFYSVVVVRTPAKKYLFPAVGWILLTFFWAVVRNHALSGGNGVSFAEQLLSVVKNLPAVIPFLGKMLFPFDLSVFPILADMKVSTLLGIVAIVVLAVVAGITKPKRWLLYLFCISWFLGFLIPSFVSVNNLIRDFSEHRSYLSLVGILLFFIATDPVKKADFSKMMPVLAISGVGILFVILSFIHTRYFKDQFTFWQNAVDTSPTHAFNYNNLGAMYYLAGDLEKAEPLFRKALQINPAEPIANGNTGLVCMNTGRPAEAERYYLEEIRINPTYDHAYYNLGLLYYNQSKMEEGIQQWEKTLTVNPGYIDAYKALIFAYEKLNRAEDYRRIVLKAKENGIVL